MSGVLPLDWWTLARVAGGMALAVVGIGVWRTFGLLAGFEGLEWVLAVLVFVAAGAFLESQGNRLHWTRRVRKWVV